MKYHFLFFLIGLNDSAHCMIDTTFVQVLVGLDLVAILVSDSHQKKSSLPAINRYLPDDFIKALIIQLFSGWTESDLSRLTLCQSFV